MKKARAKHLQAVEITLEFHPLDSEEKAIFLHELCNLLDATSLLHYLCGYLASIQPGDADMKFLGLALIPLALGAPAALANDWSGPYGALGVSYADVSFAGRGISEDTLLSLIAGARMGMDNGLVLGLEADYSNTTLSSDYLGTLRGIGGVQMFDSAGMLFLSLGYADITEVAEFSGGLAVGAGFETKITEQISFRFDVTNSRLRINDTDPDVDGLKVDFLTTRAAVSYQF